MATRIHAVFDDDVHQRLLEAKGSRTWSEAIKEEMLGEEAE